MNAMATAQSIPATVADAAGGAIPPVAEVERPPQALVPVSPFSEDEAESEFDGPVARLPVELDVAVPVRDFRVRRLLGLMPGEVIVSRWSYGEDMPLAAGEVQLAWTEFEVIDAQLAVRITRLP
jgi:Type III flagellar switch regulator (C-ring) FliN C-term